MNRFSDACQSSMNVMLWFQAFFRTYRPPT